MTATQAVIGLEIHAQLCTRSKLFCSCGTRFSAAPNTQVCPVCLGHPGVLPTVNREAVRLGLRAAAALGATIARLSSWARKSYFYPDLPKGYQITQYARPLASGGQVPFEFEGRLCHAPLTRLHLEEDAGRLRHEEDEQGACSLVDLNRCGIPLLEIVTEPTLASPEEARAMLISLRQILQYAGVTEAAMEKGHLRCDANVSVRPAGGEGLRAKTEIKNLNSMRHVRMALAEEIERQSKLLAAGAPAMAATVLWDETSRRTRLLRTKESQPDYRYFPEPDLPDLIIEVGEIEEAAGAVGERPYDRRRRFGRDYGLSSGDARILTRTRAVADFFEAVAQQVADPPAAAGFIIGELAGALGGRGRSLEDPGLGASALGELLNLVANGRLSGRQAKGVLSEMLSTHKTAGSIVHDQALRIETNETQLRAWIDEVLSSHPAEVRAYQKGKTALFGFFVGQVMRLSRGRADPALTQRLLERRLQLERL